MPLNPSSLTKDSVLNIFKTSQVPVILLVTVFIMLTGNHALFKGIFKIYPLTVANAPFLTSLALFFTALTAMFFLAVCHGKATRWVLALFLVIASQSAYYMDHFGVIIDTVMIDNVMQTNAHEFAGLITPALIMNTILFGLIPASLVLKFTPRMTDARLETKARVRALALSFILIILLIVPFIAGYTSFIREHKIVRFSANPTYTSYSAIKYVTQQFSISKNTVLHKTAEDAVLLDPPTSKKELIIMVVGETARADRFSLNGYHRDTNPLLAKENIVNLSNVTACGTSTSVSVPCMFSSLGRNKYDKETALEQENILDVLAKNGIEILWRDNNSDSKGVATRMVYEDFKTPTHNPVCEGECRDIGMLSGLDKYIASHKDKDMLIVLHQMGNHGPEYYRRYPKEFERFKPACQTGELRDCTQQEVNNAYDNAILYTDYFLSEVIHFLKKYDDHYETAMLYVADHGESLGEHGIYLHAAPYIIAPKEQTHVPAILWMGQNFEYQAKDLTPYKDYAFSHDDVFCTLLVAYEIESKTCAAKNGLLARNHNLKSYAGNLNTPVPVPAVSLADRPQKPI
ncbi:phosphoethanolamine transferase [Methylotenera sp. G11]|uniref:phosphoethanolamine transferase n=1 Tax=Methylotenera sp. G11 TaxID=1506585 RepID=UPI000690DA33|nr:phosphoethanolamine--lipid A transferase [Methylotenera sp. G11]